MPTKITNVLLHENYSLYGIQDEHTQLQTQLSEFKLRAIIMGKELYGDNYRFYTPTDLDLYI